MKVKINLNDGKESKTSWPVLVNTSNDKIYKFLKSHQVRFDYIIFKNAHKFDSIVSFYPDTVKIQNSFCENIIGQKEVQTYFSALTPKKLNAWSTNIETFSESELMLVASKYFYCHRVNEKDTSIVSKICVGINGQKEYKSDRDLSLLEAFTLDAIFHYTAKKKTSSFYIDFINNQRDIMIQNKVGFKDFDNYLNKTRAQVYLSMQSNENLKYCLLKYYKKNKNNLNFIITQ